MNRLSSRQNFGPSTSCVTGQSIVSKLLTSGQCDWPINNPALDHAKCGRLVNSRFVESDPSWDASLLIQISPQPLFIGVSEQTVFMHWAAFVGNPTLTKRADEAVLRQIPFHLVVWT